MIGRRWRKRIKRKTILLGLAGMIMLTGCSTVRETLGRLEIYGSSEKIAQSGDSYSYKAQKGQPDPSGADLGARFDDGESAYFQPVKAR